MKRANLQQFIKIAKEEQNKVPHSPFANFSVPQWAIGGGLLGGGLGALHSYLANERMLPNILYGGILGAGAGGTSAYALRQLGDVLQESVAPINAPVTEHKDGKNPPPAGLTRNEALALGAGGTALLGAGAANNMRAQIEQRLNFIQKQLGKSQRGKLQLDKAYRKQLADEAKRLQAALSGKRILQEQVLAARKALKHHFAGTHPVYRNRLDPKQFNRATRLISRYYNNEPMTDAERKLVKGILSKYGGGKLRATGRAAAQAVGRWVGRTRIPKARGRLGLLLGGLGLATGLGGYALNRFSRQ